MQKQAKITCKGQITVPREIRRRPRGSEPRQTFIRKRRQGLWLAELDRSSLGSILGRDHEAKKRNHHNLTIRGSMREAHAYLKEEVLGTRLTSKLAVY